MESPTFKMCSSPARAGGFSLPFGNPIVPFSKFPPLFSPQNFQHFPPHGILELHLRVIWCNTCSSIIVSTDYPKNVQLTTDESKRFFKDEQKMQSTEISHF